MKLAYKPLERVTQKQNTFIEEKKEYFPTWYEFAAKNREQIIVTGFVAGTGNDTIYSVPINKKFYLTGIYHSFIVKSGGVGNVASVVYIEGTGKELIYRLADQNQNISDQIYIPFIMPLKINSGSSLILVNTSNAITESYVILFGFLEDLGQN